MYLFIYVYDELLIDVVDVVLIGPNFETVWGMASMGAVLGMLPASELSYPVLIYVVIVVLNTAVPYRKLGLPPRLPLGDNFLISPGAGKKNY